MIFISSCLWSEKFKN